MLVTSERAQNMRITQMMDGSMDGCVFDVGEGEMTNQVIEDLVAYYTCHLEGLLVGDRVHDYIAVNTDEVLRVKNAVFILEREAWLSAGVPPSYLVIRRAWTKVDVGL